MLDCFCLTRSNSKFSKEVKENEEWTTASVIANTNDGDVVDSNLRCNMTPQVLKAAAAPLPARRPALSKHRQPLLTGSNMSTPRQPLLTGSDMPVSQQLRAAWQQWFMSYGHPTNQGCPDANLLALGRQLIDLGRLNRSVEHIRSVLGIHDQLEASFSRLLAHLGLLAHALTSDRQARRVPGAKKPPSLLKSLIRGKETLLLENLCAAVRRRYPQDLPVWLVGLARGYRAVYCTQRADVCLREAGLLYFGRGDQVRGAKLLHIAGATDVDIDAYIEAPTRSWPQLLAMRRYARAEELLRQTQRPSYGEERLAVAMLHLRRLLQAGEAHIDRTDWSHMLDLMRRNWSAEEHGMAHLFEMLSLYIGDLDQPRLKAALLTGLGLHREAAQMRACA